MFSKGHRHVECLACDRFLAAAGPAAIVRTVKENVVVYLGLGCIEGSSVSHTMYIDAVDSARITRLCKAMDPPVPSP